MPRIYYLTRINFNSDKANVYNTAKTCEALSLNSDAKVILVSTDDSLRTEQQKTDFFNKHSIRDRFEIISLLAISNRLKYSKLRLVNWLEVIAANISLSRFLFREWKNIDLIYFRDPFIFLPAIIGKFILRKPLFFEIHAVLHRWHGQFLNNLLAWISDGLVVISYGLADFYKKYNKNLIVSFCAASEPERFSGITGAKADLREKLGLPFNKTLLGYTGNLYITGNNDPYGIEDIIRTMPFLDESIFFVGVGKKGEETKSLENLAKELGVSERVLFLPWVSKSEIAAYLLAFDILLIPAAGAQIGNSPTKMFEYLTAGRPIVAANTQAISEVLINGRNALLVDYKNPVSWKEAILKILNNQDLASALVDNAKKDSPKYSWKNRGNEIFSFITRGKI